MAEMRTITTGLRFPEGPVAMPDGSVIVVEIESGQITRVHPDGTKSVVARPGGGPNGLAMGPEGKLYCVNNGGFDWNETGGPAVPIARGNKLASNEYQNPDKHAEPANCFRDAPISEGNVD